MVCNLDEYSLIPISKVFLMEVSDKHVPYKCVKDGTSEEYMRYSCLRGSVLMSNGLSLEGEIVRYPSVSLSPTLSINEIVEQHIRKKTHKPNVLKFWVGGGVIPLCEFWLNSHCLRSPLFSLEFSQQLAIVWSI